MHHPTLAAALFSSAAFFFASAFALASASFLVAAAFLSSGFRYGDGGGVGGGEEEDEVSFAGGDFGVETTGSEAGEGSGAPPEEGEGSTPLEPVGGAPGRSDDDGDAVSSRIGQKCDTAGHAAATAAVVGAATTPVSLAGGAA